MCAVIFRPFLKTKERHTGPGFMSPNSKSPTELLLYLYFTIFVSFSGQLNSNNLCIQFLLYSSSFLSECGAVFLSVACTHYITHAVGQVWDEKSCRVL